MIKQLVCFSYPDVGRLQSAINFVCIILWQRKGFTANTQKKKSNSITDRGFPLSLPVNGKVQTRNKHSRVFHSKEYNVKKKNRYPRPKSRIYHVNEVKFHSTQHYLVVIIHCSWQVLRSSFRPGQGTHQRPFCLANSLGIVRIIPFANKTV